MSGEDTNYYQPGDINLQGIKIISAVSGRVIDIGNLVVEFNIYSSIYSHYLMCDFVLIDGMNLYDWAEYFGSSGDKSGGFTGFDYLVISYKNRGDSDGKSQMSHLFRLYELKARKVGIENTETYVISGISIEAYQNASKRISRAMKGTIDSMVQRLYSEFFEESRLLSMYSQFNSVAEAPLGKLSYIDAKTDGEQNFILPNLTVDDSIDFLCSEADNSKHVPVFLFYEDLDGYSFKDLIDLSKEEPTLTYYNGHQNNPYSSDLPNADPKKENSFRIVNYEVKRQMNALENIRNGMYKAKTLHLDILMRQYREVPFDYEQKKAEFQNLQPTKFFGGTEIHGDAAFYTLMTSRTNHDKGGPFAAEGHKPKRINEFLDTKRSYRKQIFNTVLNITIPCNTELRVGKTIMLYFPVNSGVDQDKDKHDDHLSGKYLVSKIRHKFNGGKTGAPSYSVLECCKDTSLLPDL